MRGVRRLPLPLVLLLAAAAISGVTWSLVKPALQGPDELSHFTYVQRIVDRQSIPWRLGDIPAEPPAYRSESYVAEIEAGLRALSNNVNARPLWTKPDEAVWRGVDRGTDRSTGGETSTFKNPPLYYLYAAVPYAAGHGGSFFDRLFLIRIANVLLYLAALAFLWLLAGELLGRRSLQFVATAAAAFVPQLLNIVATVDPDILLVAEWSAAFYVMVLVLKRGLAPKLLAALAALCAASALTHGRGLPLILPAVMTVVIAFARQRGWRRVTPLRVSLGAWLAYLAVVIAWAGRGEHSDAREFASYVWQFYLPALPGMKAPIGPPGFGARQAWSDHLWGGLSHLEVVLPPGLADVMWVGMRVGLALLVVVAIARFRAVRAQSPILLVLGSAVLSLLLTLHLVAYRAMISFPGDPILAGRYVLPLVALFGLSVAAVVSVLPRRLEAAAAGAIAAGGVALQLLAAGLLLERFYA
jgi:4-amino-4-deoxy-L-arabinose transferase-like glycosyltransferase